MRDTSVAARYAKALFLVTEKRQETERALEDIKASAAALAPGTRIANYLVSPQSRLADKRELLRKGFGERVLPAVLLFLDLLMRKRRFALFSQIAPEFERLVEHAQGVRRAHVVSAVALQAEESRRLHRTLEAATGAKIKLTAEVDPALVGGVLVRIGERVIDRSVRTLLESIAYRLHEVRV